MKYLFLFFVLFLGSFQMVFAQPALEWSAPGENSSAALPLGNGQVAASVWTPSDSTISLYVSRIDALSEIGRILKLGRIDIRTTGVGAAEQVPFSERLSTASGEVVITKSLF